MDRLLILGCSGSGKSTLSRKLGRRLQLPVIHLDRLYWEPGWRPVARDVFDARLAAALAEPCWIMDGNFDRTLRLRLQHCDTAVYLDYPRIVCLWGVCKRVLTHLGRTRGDMGAGCPERVDFSFLRWVWGFKRKYGPANEKLLQEAEYQGVTVFRFHNRGECRRWLNALPLVENQEDVNERL